MPRILVVNDDGYQSPGIHILATALGALGDVTIVAPITEMSAVGHALTLRRPLRLVQHRANVFSVDGTPTDCVNLAISEVLKGAPDIVVSGINKGLNIGDDVTYSGTVAGAFEAALLGYPAIAVSLQFTTTTWDFEPSARIAADITSAVLTQGLPSRTFLNVNVPAAAVQGVRVTVQAKRNHITKIARRLDPRGQPYFWVEEANDEWEPDPQSDHQAILDGFASVTPLQPDLTDRASLALTEALTQGVRLS